MRMVTVKSNDTLWQIARKNGISLESLLIANPQIRDPNKIYPGDKVLIPVDEDKDDNSQWSENDKNDCGDRDTHGLDVNRGAVTAAEAGDTIKSIARRFGIGAETLSAVNRQLYTVELKGGEQIYLPGFYHRRHGESLYAIAALYGVGLEALLMANPDIDDSEELSEVEKVAIPRRDNGDIGIYVVRAGDSLYRIAHRYHIPISALTLANPEIKDPDLIYPEQVLSVPGPHIAEGGQTLADIAALYDQDLDDLSELNPEFAKGTIPDGVSIRLMMRSSCALI